MYNNDVTYNDKWDTPENKAALAKLEARYFDRSYCAPSCPTAWAPEVLDLLERLNTELGIEFNTSTLRAYYPQGDAKEWFVTGPWKGLFSAFNTYFIKKPDYLKDKSLKKNLSRLVEAFVHPIKYGFRCVRVLKVNPILNKIFKPKLRLTQFKEKYGSLTIYFDCPPAFEEYVENEIRKTNIRLALKGCYYPVESFWDYATSYNVGNEFEPDTIEVKQGVSSYDNKPYTTVTKTTYRKAMMEMGLDLKEIEEKAILRKASKVDP